ncbi:MAG: hypothetical protein AAFO02_18555 [Bacteroidota bacterium]
MLRAYLFFLLYFLCLSFVSAQHSFTWGAKLYYQPLSFERHEASLNKNNRYPIGRIVPAVSLLVQREKTYLIDIQINRLAWEDSPFASVVQQFDFSLGSDLTYQVYLKKGLSFWLGGGTTFFYTEREVRYMGTFGDGFTEESIWGGSLRGVTRLQYALHKRWSIDVKAPLFSLALIGRRGVGVDFATNTIAETSLPATEGFSFFPGLYLGLEYRLQQ